MPTGALFLGLIDIVTLVHMIFKLLQPTAMDHTRWRQVQLTSCFRWRIPRRYLESDFG